MADKKRNITITQLSPRQYEWLINEAEKKALTLTSVMKILIENEIAREGCNGEG